jgi:hypothetical protein
MVLEKRIAEIIFSGGLDNKTADELQSTSTLTEAANLRYRKSGRLEKRSTFSTATATFSSAPNGEPIEALFTNQNRPIAVSRTAGCGGILGTALTLPGDINAPQKPMASRVSRFVAAQTQESTYEAGIWCTSTSVVNGQIVTAHMIAQSATQALVVIRVFDETTNKLIGVHTEAITPYTVVGVAFLQVCPIANKNGVVVAWSTGTVAPFDIAGLKYDTTTKTFGSAVTMVSADVGSFNFCMVDSTTSVHADGSFFLAYHRFAGTMRCLRLQYSDLTTVLATHNALHSAANGLSIVDSGAIGPMLGSADANSGYMELFGSPATYATMYTPGAGVAITGASIAATTESGSASAVLLVNCTRTPTGTLTGTVLGDYVQGIYSLYAAAPAVTASKTITGVRCISHGLTLDNQAVFAFAAVGGSYAHMGQQAYRSGYSCLLIRLSSTGNIRHVDVIARFGHDRTTLGYSGINSLSRLTLGSDRTISLTHLADASPVNILVAATLAQTAFCTRIKLANNHLPLSYTEVQSATLVASGELFDFDGQWPIETQPRARPTLAIDTSIVGTTTIADTLSVIAIYTYVDQAGRLHRSPPSQAVTLTAQANKAFKAYVSEPPASAYSGFGGTGGSSYAQGIGCELYTTTDGGSVYYLAVTSASRKHTYDYSTTNSPFFVFTNVQISGGDTPQLYSDGSPGSELWSEPPPSFISVARIGDRVWGVDAEERSRIWYSKPLVPGYAVEWNTACTLTIGDRGVAVEDVSGVPVVFAENGIWTIAGDGPNANGVGSFAPPQRLPQVVETICPTGVCKTPAGVAIRERRGVSILSGYDVVRISNPIDMRLSQLDTSDIVKLAYDQHFNELRVIDGVDSEVLVFNFDEKKWTNWYQAIDTQNMRDAAFCAGRMWYTHQPYTARWQLRRELGSDEANHNVSIENTSYETPWIRLDQIAGFGRVWRFNLILRIPDTGASNTAIMLYVYGDEESNVIASRTYYDSSALGKAAGELIEIVIAPDQQRLSRIKMQVGFVSTGSTWGDADNNSNVGGYAVGARLIYGVQPGNKRQTDKRAR